MRRAVVVTTLGASLLGLASPALAAPPKGEWVPAEPVEASTVMACGTQVTVSEAVDKERTRTYTRSDGVVVTEYVGTLKIALTTARRSVVVNASGPESILEYPDGHVVIAFKGGTIFAPTNAAEAALIAGLGLPQIFVGKGPFTLTIAADGTESLTRPSSATDVCRLLA